MTTPLGHNPRYVTPCRYFIKGNCRYGNGCWYTHQQMDPKMLAVWKDAHGDCKNYALYGGCVRGEKCDFKHEKRSHINTMLNQLLSKGYTPCPAYLEYGNADHCGSDQFGHEPCSLEHRHTWKDVLNSKY